MPVSQASSAPPQSISRKMANKPLPRKSDPGPYPLPTSQGLIPYPHPNILETTFSEGMHPKSNQVSAEAREFHSHQNKTGLYVTTTSLDLPHTSRWAPGNPVQPRPKTPSMLRPAGTQKSSASEILGHSIAFNVSPINSNGEMTQPGSDLTILYHRVLRHP